MKKKLIIALVALILGYLSISSYIDSNKKQYVEEIIEAYNRAEGDTLKFALKDFKDDYALIEVQDLESGSSFDINTSLEGGPILSTRAIVALLKLNAKKNFKEFMSKESAKELDKVLKKPIELEYEGLLDFMHIMHEDIKISNIDFQDSDSSLYISPILVESDYVLKTLAGKTMITSNRIIFKDMKSSDKLDIKKPFLKAKFDEFRKDEPIYGEYLVGSDDISLYLKDKNPIHIGLNLGINLNRNSLNNVDFEISSRVDIKDESTQKIASNIKEIEFDISFKDLGLEGIKEIIKLEKEQRKLQADLAKALEDKNDIAMQKAIIAMQKLENAWVNIYNKLLIKDKTKLILDKEIKAKKLSKVHIDLTFTGDKLSGDGIGALITLGTRVDKLFKGDIDITIEKEIVEKLYPQLGFILESMKKNNLVKLNDGLYTLKAKIEDGKIIINGTKYTPQELALIILM